MGTRCWTVGQMAYGSSLNSYYLRDSRRMLEWNSTVLVQHMKKHSCKFKRKTKLCSSAFMYLQQTNLLFMNHKCQVSAKVTLCQVISGGNRAFCSLSLTNITGSKTFHPFIQKFGANHEKTILLKLNEISNYNPI